MASCSTSSSGKKETDPAFPESKPDLASLSAAASAHWLQKSKGSLVAVHCTCEEERKFRLRLGRLCPEARPSKQFLETAFQVFAQERDNCSACKSGIKRTREKCSCQDSFNFLMSLIPPYVRPVFPSNDDIVGAELDWMYEAERCLYCTEHGGIDAQRLQYKQKRESQYRPVGSWVWTNGQKCRIVMNDYNPFKCTTDEDGGAEDDDDDDIQSSDEDETDSQRDYFNFGFL